MPTTIAVLSQKGGTGKTTTVRTLTDVFRRAGLSVLAVDLDPQANLSDYFGLDPELTPTIADVLAGNATIRQADHGGIVPAAIGLAEAELTLAGKLGRELTLRRALAALADQYELILIDCPPALGLLTVNALVAADQAVISAEAQYFSLQGVQQAVEMVDLARETLNPRLELLAILANIADLRTRHSREAIALLRGHFGDRVLATAIRQSIAYAESAERGVSILDHRPALGADYLAVAGELLERLGLAQARQRLGALGSQATP